MYKVQFFRISSKGTTQITFMHPWIDHSWS